MSTMSPLDKDFWSLIFSQWSWAEIESLAAYARQVETSLTWGNA